MELKIDEEFRLWIPPQRQDEHKLLEESILSNGFDPAYPIVTWDGFLVDGHNRYDICKKYDIEFTVSEKNFPSRHEALNWIIDNQLSRRNITDDQRAYLIGKRYKEEKKAIGENQYTIPYNIQETDGTHLSDEQRQYLIGKKYSEEMKDASERNVDDSLNRIGHSVQPSLGSKNLMPTAQKIAEQTKVNEKTVRRAEKFADAVDKVAENVGINPQQILSGKINATKKDIKAVSEIEPKFQKKVFEKVEAGKVKNVKEALKEVKHEIIEEMKDEVVLPEPIKLINSDFIDINFEPNSIDFIITDPPYPKEYLPLYEDLAKMANSVLKNGGSLLVMVGQSYLPEILNMIAPYLRYHWTLGYFTPGGQSAQLWQKKVNTFWKPVLWFTKGEYTGDWIGDVVKSDSNDKNFHEWGQSENGMYDLMKRFVKPGDVVLDPFLGGGTTGLVCKHLKCEFIGIEKDVSVFNTAKVRLGEF